MHMKDFLAGSGTVVEDKPKGIRNTFLIRNNFCCQAAAYGAAPLPVRARRCRRTMRLRA